MKTVIALCSTLLVVVMADDAFSDTKSVFQTGNAYSATRLARCIHQYAEDALAFGWSPSSDQTRHISRAEASGNAHHRTMAYAAALREMAFYVGYGGDKTTRKKMRACPGPWKSVTDEQLDLYFGR